MPVEKTKGKAKWGLVVELRSREGLKKNYEYYDIFIAPFQKGKAFVSNQHIQAYARQMALDGRKPTPLGSVDAHVNRRSKIIHFKGFWPVGVNYNLVKKGLASLVELEIVKDLKKRYPGHLFKASESASIFRLEQHWRRGVKTPSLIPIEEYYQILLKDIRAGVKKARGKAKAKKKKRKPAARKPR